MGCCLNKQVKEKDEPLLSEHLTGTDNDNVIDSVAAPIISIESTQIIKNDEHKVNIADDDVMDEDTKWQEVEKEAKEKIKMKKKTKRRNEHQKRDSLIDVKDLAKFDDFNEKMKEKEDGIIVSLSIKSMDTNFPVFKVSIDQNLCITDLKQRIFEQSPDEIIALRQRLIHKGRLLKDARTLRQYKIGDGQTVMLVRSRRNQQKNKKTSSRNGRKSNKRLRAMTSIDSSQIMIRSKSPQPQQFSQVY